MYKFGKPGTPHWHINLVKEHDLNIKITARSPALQHPFINDNSFSPQFPSPGRTPRWRTGTGCFSEARQFLEVPCFKPDAEIGLKMQKKEKKKGRHKKIEARPWSQAGRGGCPSKPEQWGSAGTGALPRDPSRGGLSLQPLTTRGRGIN